MVGMLTTLGIQKGKPFAPDARTTAILEQAARDVYEYLGERLRTGKFYTVYWPDRQWGAPALSPEVVKGGAQFVFQDRVETLTRARDVYFWAVAVPKRFGGPDGTIYLVTALEQAGQSLDGDKTYRLRVPANVPARDFWSVIAYSVNTRTFVEGKPAVSSNDTGMKKNGDGTVDIWFGPKPRSGEEANSIVTKPGENYFVIFRFYGAEDPIRDKTWKLVDFEPVK